MTPAPAAFPVLCLHAAGPAVPGAGALAVETITQCFEADPDIPALAALRECARRHPGRDIVLLARDTTLPAGGWERLCATRAWPFDIVSPLSDAIPELDPFGTATRPATPADADACLWMLGEEEPIPVAAWSPACSLWRAAALAELAGDLVETQVPVGMQAALLDTLFVATTRRPASPSRPAATTPVAIAVLRSRITALGGRIPVAVGRDSRPVLLHILHGWGGGVEHFVENLMRSADGWRHLALVARGSSARRQPGESLALHDDLHAAPLARWPLALGIGSTALASGEYGAILARVVRRFRVGRVLVSSLIGHGLEALRSGLPTALVCHDYYPLWPHLHEDFGDATRDFSAAALAGALRAPGPEFAFAETRATAWQRLREDYVSALRALRPLLLCPSRSVHDNLVRIEPRLADLDWQHLPHGIEPWPEPVTAILPPARAGLRVLVLGRINGGKGEDLLARLLPLLDPRIELLLLGAGRAGMRFFGHAGVHLRMDYRREELPRLVRDFAPDLALIPASVAETFSYTLSELWSLGVPVLATRLGSLAERIVEGENGLLATADAEAIAARLHALLRDRGPLHELRTPRAQPSLRDMAQRYVAALSTASMPWPPLPAIDAPGSNRRNALEHERDQVLATLHDAGQRLAEQARELDRRGDWGDALQQQLDARTDWARSLASDLDGARAHVASLDAELDERSRWALSLREELDTTQADLDTARQAHAEKEAELAALTHALHSAVTHGETMQRDRDQILASRSWRMTRPFRHAVRLLVRARTRINFRWQRLGSICRRTLASLRSRGVNGTASRIRDELRPPRPLPVESLPIPARAADAAGILLPGSEQPRISIVIPVYNHLDATLVCLHALARTKNRTPHEIILVDDCSSDDSARVLPPVPGLRYQRNPQNLGFIGACNAGAESARGEYVLFLNNDTAVQDGWLDALIDTFEQHRDVGLVGAKLVYPDGRLQEAGGIVFADGSGWNYGRFDDPAKPEYNFVREVDYCSGAAIMLRTDLFRRFGGFDRHYAPAYYEDTDLAMKVRQAGLRVLYQPASVVVHFEGISSGTDTASGTKRYQLINKEKFLERWKDALASHPSPELATQEGVKLARQHRAKKRVLVIDATTPQPDHDSGSVRLVNILRLLLEEGCAVSFFADNRAYVDAYSHALQQMGVEVLWHPFLSDPVRWFEDNGKYLDLVFVSRHYIASNYVELVRRHAPKARLAFDTVDLHYLREQRAAELAGSSEMARAAEKTRERELALIRASDVTLVVSPVEQELLAREAPGSRVDILSNVHAVFGRRRGFAERRDIMFIGGYQHPPNVDAALWFAKEILPLVRAELPEVKFHLIGSKAPAEVRALGELPGVVFHGFVTDIEPFLDGCRLAVAPLRYGAGVKGKVNMSMSYGQPVVATPIAIEGMFAEAGRDVLVAEAPQDFAREVVRACRDEALWLSLSDHGLANVERHFSFESARAAIRRLLDLPASS